MKRFWLIIITLLIFPASAFARIFYSIQLCARKNIDAAYKTLKQTEKYPDARIDIVDGYYKVRVGLFNTYDEAKEFLIKNKIRKIFKGAFIAKVDDKTLQTSIFPKKHNKNISKNPANATQNKTEKQPAKVSNSENATYSVLLYKTNNKEKAINFFKGLPDEIKKEAFLYEDNNTYSVRAFLVKGYKKAAEKEKSIGYLHFETEIKPTKREKIEKIPEPEKKMIKPRISTKPTVNSQPMVSKAKKPKTVVTKEKKTPIYFIALILAAAIAIVITGLKAFKGKAVSKEAEDMYDVLTKALEKGDTALLKEIVVPYLARYPEDLKAQELYAMALEKEGRYMEAADIYFAIAEVLEGKKQFEEAEKFKKKAEELVSREFKKK
ncbi:SPOR domain-containing protein [Desulfurobacterium sp.]